VVGLGPVSHISIGVSDLDQSLAFYRDLLGMQVRYDIDTRFGVAGATPVHRRIAFVQGEAGRGTEFYLALNEQAGRPRPAPIDVLGPGLNHFSLYVRDIHVLHGRLIGAGVPVRSPLKLDMVDPWSVDGERGVLTAMYEDPDGVVVQLEQSLTTVEAAVWSVRSARLDQ
jgi:catechol 2,3-dioxygenase-like lactoylglutathione lyase family enzyme